MSNYPDGDTYKHYDEPSGIPVPDIRPSDPRGGFTSTPDADFAAFGAGFTVRDGETVTRFKRQGFTTAEVSDDTPGD